MSSIPEEFSALGLARDELAAAIRDYFEEPDGYTLVEITIRDTDQFAAVLADVLLASSALARVIREAEAEAWDEGFRRACSDHGGYASCATGEHGQRHANPYREIRFQPTDPRQSVAASGQGLV